ncbi:MAG: hypothetical protein R2734_11820 [Nocardioides sp.]
MAEQKRFIDERVAERGWPTGSRSGCRTTSPCPSATTLTRSPRSRCGEHVGQGTYPAYVGVPRRAVRPGGRVLVQ